MTRYAEIEKALRNLIKACNHPAPQIFGYLANAHQDAQAALALPKDSKTVNAELYGLAIALADVEAKDIAQWFDEHYTSEYERKVRRYLSLREASGEPMPYKVIRDGDKVRFE